jgi:hypothetical protein
MIRSEMGPNANESFGAGAGQCLLFPISDRFADKPRATRRANSGHRAPHSITLSAIIRSLWGKVMPSVLAVLRLITSSNSVGS